MRIKVLQSVLLLCSFAVGSARTIDGDWSGKIEFGEANSLRLVLHIPGGSSSVTLDSPDQNVYGLGCRTEFLSEDSINISIPDLMMNYAGRLNGDTISGIFRQGGLSLPLVFGRGVAKVSRPQIPRPPFPYSVEDVRVENLAGSAVLSGTLTVPLDCTLATPVVLLISGSGAHNRDEEIFEHKPFAVIADYLARNGIASLRYDDRGAGESTGDRTHATTKDFASDAMAIIDWIRLQGRFGKVGVIGHSEGGMIAYMIGASQSHPDFVVSIAGPVVKGAEILDYQNKMALLGCGMSDAQATEYALEARRSIENDSSMTWMHFFIEYDPANDLNRLDIPAFIIYGERDRQVPPSLNYDRAKSLAPDATVICYPQLNHLMQHCDTGGVEEYGKIEETISPQVLSDIVSFIKTSI